MKIPKETRDVVHSRARGACEYCHLPQEASALPIKLITSSEGSTRGSDDADNLCLCCIRCNLKKGPNIASIDPETGLIVPLFHPRLHSWREHFSLDQDGRLHGQTPEGRVTVQLMDMNDVARVSLRSWLLRGGSSP